MNTRLLIIAHAPLAHALRECALHVFPDCWQEVLALDVPPHEAPEATLLAARALMEQQGEASVLVLSDLFGATPCNAARKLVVPGKVAMLTGLNAPMMIKAVQYSSTSTDLLAFTECVRKAAVDGIIAITNPPEESC